MEFDCSGCGLCCKVMAKKAVEGARTVKESGRKLSELQKALVNFPYGFKGGACEKYNEETRQCDVYGNRPDVCSVNKSFRRFAKDKQSRKQYYELNGRECNKMIRENGEDQKYLVKETY